MSEFEISLLCSSVISYYQVQNGISPVKRLYVRNASDFDCENIEISVSSKPDFLLPVSEIQAVFPARANLRFDGIACGAVHDFHAPALSDADVQRCRTSKSIRNALYRSAFC